jgi:hypothetical protein
MEIKFARKGTGEVFIDKETTKFFNYKYLTGVKLNNKLKKQSIQFFIRVVNLLKFKLSKEEGIFECEKLIKLIHLRKDLLTNKSFNMPLNFSPVGIPYTGDGRVLIATFYAPETEFDCVYHQETFGNFSIIEKLLDDILTHSFIKNQNLDNKMSVFCLDSIMRSDGIFVEAVRGIEIFDSYIFYQNLYDRENGPFFTKDTLRITQLWDEVYDILSSQTVENLSDYISILHKITSIEV